MNSCKNNPEKSYTEKKAMHETSGWNMAVKCSFDATKDRRDYYRGKDCIEKLCKKLKDYAMEIIKYKEKEMIPLTDEENKSYERQKFVTHAKQSFVLSKTRKMNLNYTKKSEIIDITLENLEELLIEFEI